MVLAISFNAYCNSYESIVNKASLIQKSSINYFKDVGNWPNSVDEMINTGYLLYADYTGFTTRLSGQNLNILISNVSSKRDIDNYLIDGFWHEDIFVLTINIPKTSELSKKEQIDNTSGAYVFFCSNIFCLKTK